MKVMTFNIRVDVDSDGINSFKNRIPAVVNFLKQELPDVIGFQEMKPHMLKTLAAELTNYDFVGEARADNDEYNPIFFRKSFKLISAKTYWLGSTPNIKGSKHPDAYFPRIFTTVILEKHNFLIEIINTHLSHISHQARIDGLKQIMKYIDERKNPHPVVLIGDFNAYPDEMVNDILAVKLNSCWKKYVGDGLTFHDFSSKTKGNPIDYLFVDKRLAFDTVTIHRDKPKNNYLSDHYPVSIIIN